jgi:hypothetical protein
MPINLVGVVDAAHAFWGVGVCLLDREFPLVEFHDQVQRAWFCFSQFQLPFGVCFSRLVAPCLRGLWVG